MTLFGTLKRLRPHSIAHISSSESLPTWLSHHLWKVPTELSEIFLSSAPLSSPPPPSSPAASAKVCELSEPGRPLDKQRWAGVVDTVGSTVLANALAQTQYGGAVAACGLAAGFDLPTTVMPFILRNVALLGVDSVMCPFEKRQRAWQRLVELLPQSFYEQATTEIELEQVAQYAEDITNGQVTGRVVIKLS